MLYYRCIICPTNIKANWDMQEHVTFCDRLKQANSAAYKKIGQTLINNGVATTTASGFVGLLNAGYSGTHNLCNPPSETVNQLVGAAVIGGSVAALTITAGIYIVQFTKELTCPEMQR